MNEKSLDLGGLCRTCMSNRARVSSGTNAIKLKRWIYEKPPGWTEGQTIMDLLRSVQPDIRVHLKDKLPKIMCHDCIEQLQMSYEFLQMCKDSDEKFRKMLKEDDTNYVVEQVPPIKEELDENSPILKYEIEVDQDDDNTTSCATGSQHTDFESMLGHNSSAERRLFSDACTGYAGDWISMETRKKCQSQLYDSAHQDLTDVQYSADHMPEREAANGLKRISDDMIFLKETVYNQNRTILELVSEIKVMLKSTAIPVPVSQKYSSLFPISSFDKLNEVETEITDETKHVMISTLKGIIGNCGIKKELELILDISIILAFNVDGKQNKLRFLQYPKFIDSLYRAVFTEELTLKQFLKELRQAFRLAKNRYHKKQSLKRSRASYSSEDEQSEEFED